MKKSLIFLIIPLLFSCEGITTTSGIVISESTGKPIENAEINVLNNIGDSTKTDEFGSFRLSHFTGMVFGGPTFKFEVKKEGYETQIIHTKFGVDTLKLVAK